MNILILVRVVLLNNNSVSILSLKSFSLNIDWGRKSIDPFFLQTIQTRKVDSLIEERGSLFVGIY